MSTPSKSISLLSTSYPAVARGRNLEGKLKVTPQDPYRDRNKDLQTLLKEKVLIRAQVYIYIYI